MPVITVMGLPHDLNGGPEFDRLELTLKSVPCRLTAFDAVQDQVSVFFVPSLSQTNTRIVVYVDLVSTPKRTTEAQRMLAEMIADELVVFAAHRLDWIKRILVFMRPFNPEQEVCIRRDVKVPLEG